MRNLVGLFAALATVLGPLVAHFELTRPLTGFAVFALGGIVSLVVGLVSLVQLVRGRGLTLGGGLAVLIGGVFVAIASRGAGLPRINDFTTDMTDPPPFLFAPLLPGNEGRDLAYPREFAAVQAECCKDLRPAKVAAPPIVAFERTIRVAGEMPGWRVTRTDSSDFAIEAVVTTPLFRFQDDVVIRLRGEPGGATRVDVRSKSRDGKGDIGANTTRIRQFVERLEAAK